MTDDQPIDDDQQGIAVLAVEETVLLGGGDKVWERIDPGVLRQNLGSFVSNLDKAIPGLEATSSGFHLESFEASLTVGAKGEVGFLGTGVEASGQATLKLKFARKSTA